MLNKWAAHKVAQKGGDPEALVPVETAGSGFTFMAMFKGPGAQQSEYFHHPRLRSGISAISEYGLTLSVDEDASVLETGQKMSMSTKMKRVFQKFGRDKVADDNPPITMVGTSATNTVGRNSGEWSAEPPMYVTKKDDGAEIVQSRAVEVADNEHDAIKPC